MINKKREPAVISIKVHREKVKQLEDIALSTINQLNDRIRIETKANENLRIEHQKLLNQLTEVNSTCKALQVELKAKMDLITQLHNDLGRAREQAEFLKLASVKFSDEIKSLKKSQKKWYHFF